MYFQEQKKNVYHFIKVFCPIVDADWLNRLFENAHVESGTDGKIIIVVNQ
jgi:hypothetical protein